MLAWSCKASMWRFTQGFRRLKLEQYSLDLEAWRLTPEQLSFTLEKWNFALD
jgi:hypothetical protein